MGLVASAEPNGLGLDTLGKLLGSRASFRQELIEDGHAGLMRDAIRAQTAAFPAGEPGAAIIRTLIYEAREHYTTEVQVARTRKVKRAEKEEEKEKEEEDDAKPLPASDLEGRWDELTQLLMGYLQVLEQFRLSQGIMSRMIRACRKGRFWMPSLDQGFKYDDSASNSAVTTVLRAASSTTDAKLLLVQGQQYSERQDIVRIVSDVTDMLSHRSAAVIAAYCGPTGRAEFAKSPRYASLLRHASVVKGSANDCAITPYMVGELERFERNVARSGISTAEYLQLDRRILHALSRRMQSGIAEDATLSLEFVLGSFLGSESSISTTRVVDLAELRDREADMASSDVLGPSASRVGQSSVSPDAARARKLELANSRLQSERDRAVNASERGGKRPERDEKRPRGGEARGKTVFGGRDGRYGGGNPAGEEICKRYNGPEGCWAESCKYRHVCNRTMSDGKPCGKKHPAQQH